MQVGRPAAVPVGDGGWSRAQHPGVLAMTRASGGWLLVAVAVGLLTGVLTLAGQAVLPTEANRLANSGAIWVTVAFALGWRMPNDTTAAVAGLLALIGALAGYFVAASFAQAGISTSTVAIWVGVAVLGGPVFGVAGRWRGSVGSQIQAHEMGAGVRRFERRGQLGGEAEARVVVGVPKHEHKALAALAA